MDSFITLQKPGSDEFIEKKSRFIGYASPVSTDSEALSFINNIKSKNRDARHNIYAYIVCDNGNLISRYSDDGEPQGTGGIPVLDVLKKQNIINAVIVVTRYFGGILLGASGLSRAYGKAASLAVSACGIAEMTESIEVEIKVDYTFYGKIQRAFENLKVIPLPPEFSCDVVAKYIFPYSEADKLCDIIVDITNGQVTFKKGEKIFALYEQ